jgi:sugar/nucleoside kinase (ribokinase family)
VGDDLAGREILRVMKKFKVNLDLVEVAKKEETGYSIIFLNQDRDRTALVFRGAADFKQIKKIPLHKLNARWLFITTLNGNLVLLRQIFKTARQKKINLAWNPGNAELAYGGQKLKPFLKQARVVFLNLEETRTLLETRVRKIERLFEQLFKLSPATIWCVTGGKQGAWVGYQNKILWAGIIDKKVVNATGAGDAFGSGFVAGLMLYHGDLTKAFQLAMLNSNSVVTKMGAKHGLLKKPPTQKMLDKIKVKTLS